MDLGDILRSESLEDNIYLHIGVNYEYNKISKIS
jgi:hypothetical protein